MVGKTHIVGALALTSVLSIVSIKTGVIDRQQLLLHEATLLTASGIGGLLPDIDHKGSTISKQNPIVSFLVRLFFTHRGFTHSLLSLGLISVSTYLIALMLGGGFWTWVSIGFSIGYASHLILDAFNPKGVPLLFPLEIKMSVGDVKTGGIGEEIVYISLIGLTIFCNILLLGLLK